MKAYRGSGVMAALIVKFGSQGRVRALVKKIVSPERVDQLKIFVLNRKDWLSVAEWLGLVWKGQFVQSTNNGITENDKNVQRCRVSGPLLDGRAPVICTGFPALPVAL